jgi:HAD superfamily hydrolase (TIGR01509 family)
MPVKHILFDNDGTIVDSEIIASRIMLRHLALHGVNLSEQEYNMRYPGLRTRDILIALREEEGFRPPENFIQMVHEEHNREFHRSLRAIPGMTSLFRSLKVPKSMVSNGSVRHVDACLRRVRLRSAVDGHIFSAEQVGNPKPSPDVYLHALETLRLKPSETLAVEDSTTGVLAAKSAGIQVVGFLAATHIHDGHGDKLLAAGADYLIPDAKALHGLLKKKMAV